MKHRWYFWCDTHSIVTIYTHFSNLSTFPYMWSHPMAQLTWIWHVTLTLVCVCNNSYNHCAVYCIPIHRCGFSQVGTHSYNESNFLAAICLTKLEIQVKINYGWYLFLFIQQLYSIYSLKWEVTERLQSNKLRKKKDANVAFLRYCTIMCLGILRKTIKSQNTSLWTKIWI
jgi:hypothetical protein